MNLLELFVQKGILAQTDVDGVEKDIAEKGMSIEDALLRRGVPIAKILQTKSEYLNVPVKILTKDDIPSSILNYIPQESAEHYRFVPIGLSEGVLEVGLIEPDNIEARDALNFISSKIGLPFKIFLISSTDFDRVITMYKNLSGEVNKALTDLDTELIPGEGGEQDIEGDLKGGADSTQIVEDAPVNKIVATILRYATEGDASDVHIEHMREKIRVRFRVDGVLNTSLILPGAVHPQLVARIKVLSNMRLDERRKPQDGRFSAKIESKKIDFRVSTFPAFYGEKVVIRILNQEKGVRPLNDMGITPQNLELIRKSLKRPYGMILVSGPTGSGKSTTLYSMLNELDKDHTNVLSLEDPVEYNIEGISQSQVRPEIGYTFASGLRTTLRQDPDVIMVGEIRDKETAQLAVQAALTGHLVLSTIHTNNAVGVIPRLIDMGVDPYLIAPTLILTIAQRLVGTTAPGAYEEVPVEGTIKALIDREFQGLPLEVSQSITYADTVYKIKPTPDTPTGTRGRIAVMEVLPVTKEIEAAILKNPTELEIGEVARSQGMLTMREDAILKAFNKVIPFEEVNKL